MLKYLNLSKLSIIIHGRSWLVQSFIESIYPVGHQKINEQDVPYCPNLFMQQSSLNHPHTTLDWQHMKFLTVSILLTVFSYELTKENRVISNKVKEIIFIVFINKY
jgi:hypothetical protein